MAALKTLGAMVSALLIAGCGVYERRLKQDNAAEQDHNRTLAKAAMVMDGVKTWSAAHDGNLPSPTRFREEVRPMLPPTNGFGITDDELQSAFRAFEWTDPGGKVEATGAETREVGHLPDPHGDAVAYANGEVRRGFPSRK